MKITQEYIDNIRFRGIIGQGPTEKEILALEAKRVFNNTENQADEEYKVFIEKIKDKYDRIMDSAWKKREHTVSIAKSEYDKTISDICA